MIDGMFCQKCGSILVLKEGKKKKLGCKNCGYTPRGKSNIILKEKVKVNKGDMIDVVNKKVETLPKIKAKCGKCGHNKAYYWTMQTRATDEGETRFFECVKCSHRWRSYD